MSSVCFSTLTGHLGAEWVTQHDGVTYRHQLVLIDRTVLFGVSVDNRPWVNTTVRNPERFGPLPEPGSGSRGYPIWQSWVTEFLRDDTPQEA